MKTMKKLMAVALTLAMVMSLFVTCFAAGETYSITVNNKNENVTITGNTFKAYKLFDLVYSGETTSGGHDTSPHAYYLAANSAFNDGTVSDGAFIPSDGGITGILAQYFDFTVLAGDNTKYLVTPKENTTFNEAAAYTLAEELTPYLEDMTPNVSQAASGESVTLNVTNKGDAGYYLVTGTGNPKGDTTKTVTAAVALTSTDPQAVINAKVDAPPLDKTITNSNVIKSDGSIVDTLSDGGKENLAAVGDTVNYQVKGVMPNMTGYEKYFYVVTDTMSKGLTFNNDVAIKIMNSDGSAAAKNLATPGDYTVTATSGDDSTSIEIVFNNFIQYKGALQSDGTYLHEYTGNDIVITYSATVNSDAVIGNTGNPNTANLTYSNNPNQQPQGSPSDGNKPGPSDGDITGVTPDSTTKTYVAGIHLNKVDTEGNPLAGAEFKLEGKNLNSIVEVSGNIFVQSDGGSWYLLKDGTYTESRPTELNSDGYVTSGGSYVMYKQVAQNYSRTGTPNSDASFTVTTGSDGIITFTGLKQGDYTLTELAAPTGYNVLKDAIQLKIEPVIENGKFVSWKLTKTMGSDTQTQTTLAATDAQLFTFDVVNDTGVELPSTGGIGTKIFYTMGAILVIGAGVMLVSKKRVGE